MIIGIVQVSLGSQRLRRKALLPILGKPMTWWVYTRLQQSQLLDKVVLAFPEEDSLLIDFAEEFQIPYYAGSYKDVIDRLYSTAVKFEADAIVRVTGDCPMVDPDIVDMIVANYLGIQDRTDYIVKPQSSMFPTGLSLSVYPTKILRRLWSEVKDPVYREWFPAYIKCHRDRFPTHIITYSGKSLSSLRWTVDYPEDLEFVRCIYSRLGGDFRMHDVLALLEQEPYLTQINTAREIDSYYNFPYKELLSE